MPSVEASIIARDPALRYDTSSPAAEAASSNAGSSKSEIFSPPR